MKFSNWRINKTTYCKFTGTKYNSINIELRHKVILCQQKNNTVNKSHSWQLANAEVRYVNADKYEFPETIRTPHFGLDFLSLAN